MSHPEPAEPEPTDPAPAPPASLGYGEALTELEAILAELEGEDVDVDVLADRVARAAELVERCRARIDRARLEVDRVVAALTDDTPTDPPPDE